jgi:PAS domain S-box-containing protein
MMSEYGKPLLPEAFRPERDFRYSLLRDENTRLFLKLFIGLVLASVVLYLSAAVLSGEGLFRSAGALIALVASAAALALYQRGHVGGAAQILVWGTWLALMLQIFISNGLSSRSMMALPVTIMLAGWLLPPRGTLMLCLASLLAGVMLALGEQRGLLPLRTSPSPPLLVWLAYSIYIVLAAALAYFVFRGFRLRHEAMRDLGEDLAARVDSLTAREAELRLVMESVPVMLFHGDRDQRCLYANRSYADFYGVDQDRLKGLSVREIVGAETYDAFDVGATLGRALAGERFTYRAVRRTPSGEARMLDISMVPEPDGQGGTCGFFSLFRDVTEEVRAEEALRHSEEKFASVFRSSPLPVAITRLEDGRYLDVNDAFVRLFGWRREEAIGRTSIELGKWAVPEARAAWAARLRQAGRVSNLETDFRTRDGQVRRVLLSAERIEMAGEACALVMTVDITQRRAVEQALRESEERLRLATEGGGVGIWAWDVPSGRLDWNDELKTIFGLPADTGELTLEGFVAAIHPDDRARVEREFTSALERGDEFSCEYRIVRPAGSIHWIVARGRGQYGPDGKPLRMTGSAIDVTERRGAEEKFAKVFQASPVAISISRMRDGRYLDVNDAFVEQFGWGRDEFIGNTSVGIGLWPSLADREKWVAALQKSNRVRNMEAVLNSKSGARHHVIISAERIELEGEACVIGLVHDVTERLRAESALRVSEERLREAQRIGHVGSWELDPVSGRMSWSDELYRIYERDRNGFGGTWPDLLKLVHPGDLPAMKEIWREAARAEGSHELRHRILTPDGRVKHLFVRFEVFRDVEGRPVRALGTAQDITEQVLAREEIQRLNASLESRVQSRTAELLAANKELESFAYSISHDLRAPLRGIDGFSHLLAEEYAERLDDTGRGYLERVRRAAQRMGELIDDILELSRVTRQDMRRVAVDLSQVAAEVIEERARAEPERKVEVAIESGCTAQGDPQLLRVLMQNLLENAWKYTRRTEPARIAFGRETREGETVFFVRDNGVGFDMQYAERLFAPFQRLHRPEEFEGTGIGLATVARVTHRHGGRVWAEAETDKGAVFRFTLGSAG